MDSDRKDKEVQHGVLMSIVKTISSSADASSREAEKVRLEKAFSESDRRLENMITNHLSDLTSIIQTFSKISSRVTASQERIRATRENLESCKKLLHCKRDELRRLWIEGVENKTVYQMLDEIERVKDVGDKLRSHMERREYLKCTSLLVSSLTVIEGDLDDVEALRYVKIELQARKEELYHRLTDELHKLIYVKSTASVVKSFFRQGSLRQSRGSGRLKTLQYSRTVGPGASPSQVEGAALSQEEEALKLLMEAKLPEIIASRPIKEDLAVDPEADPVMFIAVLVESLSMLKRLPDAIEVLRTNIKPGLLTIIQRASQQVADFAYLDGEDCGQLQQPQFLVDLLELIFRQFRIVARVHSIVLANIQRIKNSMSSLGDFSLYDSIDVWNKVQAMLQMLLSDYLDIRNTVGSQAHQTSSLDDTNLDIGSYFGKKRPTRAKKAALFRFDASSHAISMSSYLREQRQEFYGTGDIMNGDMTNQGAGAVDKVGKIPYVCRLCASNITAIYNPLQKFMAEIEQAASIQPGTLALQSFIREFIKSIYLNQVQYSIENTIFITTKAPGMQSSLIDVHMQRELNVPKPLLQSTVVVARSVQDLCELMRDLPDYADQFINMICKILQDYLETSSQSSYRDRDLVAADSEQKRIFSATWVKDDDINRFLRSLPNWQNLKDESAGALVMSEEDLRMMNSKESTILTSNLSSRELIPQSEIIYDVEQLKTLGNLCESLEWFASRIYDMADSFKSGTLPHILTQPDAVLNTTPSLGSPGFGGSAPRDLPSPVKSVLPATRVSEGTITTLRSLSQHFLDLSEVCLMQLHLEVRIHCFYHLLQISWHDADYYGVIDKMEPDENVIRLNKDLSSIEEAMQQSVQNKKFKYIFEGLGHLVSTVLINTAQYLKRINENGIKKMCRNIFSVQQCLTNITTNRESDLDHARQYYELLYLSPDDILKSIIDNGAQFLEQEYINLIGLSHRSEYGALDTELAKRKHRLHKILNQ